MGACLACSTARVQWANIKILHSGQRPNLPWIASMPEFKDCSKEFWRWIGLQKFLVNFQQEISSSHRIMTFDFQRREPSLAVHEAYKRIICKLDYVMPACLVPLRKQGTTLVGHARHSQTPSDFSFRRVALLSSDLS